MILEAFLVFVILGRPWIGEYWSVLCVRFSERELFLVLCTTANILGYLIGSAPYIIMDLCRPWNTKRAKIQSQFYPSWKDLMRGAVAHVLATLIVVLPMLLSGAGILHRFGIELKATLPSTPVLLIHLVYFLLVEDYLNYWLHRMLHLPVLYNYIHSVHHEYNAPFALMSAYAHPAEIVILSIPTFAGPALTGCDMYTLIVWQVVRLFEAIDIHSGYQLPFSFSKLFPWYAGAQHHDYHHYMHSGNFASVFVWCDRLYGTDVGYRHYNYKKDKNDAGAVECRQ